MDPTGDITDTFDDDSLRQSIEKADKNGQWRDATGAFLDPKLEQIRKQLAEPDRADYSERRRRDLQRRALEAGAQPTKTAPVTPPVFEEPPAPPPPVDWRETVVKNPAKSPEAEPKDVFTELEQRIAPTGRGALPPEVEHPILGYVRPVLHGLAVFVPTTIVLMVVGGGRFDLLVRGVLAAIGAGVAWNEFHAGRFLAPAIGMFVYGLFFLTTPGAWNNPEIVGNMIGFLMTLMGAGVVGILREREAAAGRPQN